MLRLLETQTLVSGKTTAPPAAPILDFLLPRFTFTSGTTRLRRRYIVAGREPAAPQIHTLSRSTQRGLPSSSRFPCLNQHHRLARTPPQMPRLFSTTARRAKTQTVLNPQIDDGGSEMRLEITPRAAQRLAKVMEKDGNPRLALRIQVESGGCHGFQYLMSLVTLPERIPTAPALQDTTPANSDVPTVVREDDTIFSYVDEQHGGENPLDAPKIILDTPSLELLNGSKVDFTMELIGSQFKIVDNPLATSSCGCGTSFDIKI